MGCKEHDFAAPSLSDYLKQLLQEKGLERSRVVRMADLNETFGYQIFTGSRNPSRNKELQIAFAMALSMKETNRALTAAGVSVLNCKDRRDAIIIFCIDRGCSLQKVNDELTASLVEHLASLDRDNSYRVERVLKFSDVETTELVYFEGSGGGSLGPFVRKCINASVQIGGAYERLFAAQRAGRRFEHLPRIVDCRRMGDELDVVMEYVEGETLEALVGRLGATPDYARGLYPVLCKAVGELHAGFAAAGEPGVPVIHRDLKPSNIIVSGVRYAADAGMTFSSLVIIDLGIAHVWRDGADADTVKFGTRSYAPPEQFGFAQTDVRSDIFALGGVLFFCCVGEQPQPALDADMLARAGVPDPLAAVILRARAFDPADRYPSAAAMRGALLAACTAAGSAAAGGVAGAAAGEVDLPAATAPGPLVARPPRRSRRLTVPAAVGTCWNVILLASFVLMVAICVAMALDPPSQYRSMPFWLFALLLAGIILVPYAITLYWVADRRRLLAHVPWFSGLSLVRRIVWSIAAITVSAVGACAIGIAAGYL